jgi:hypothetical protein
MRIARRLAAAGIAVVALGGAGATAALAQTSGGTAPVVTPPVPRLNLSPPATPQADEAATNETDAAGSETALSDGPGGHQDPSGDVQHGGVDQGGADGP